MRLTHMVSGAGCASKLGQAQLRNVLQLLPKSSHPDLLVGFDTGDDAGVFRLSDGQALVQTVDFFTPIVDDPYAYGAIAAANALSDIYAMGGRPITALNHCCFNPAKAGPDVWAAILQGMYDKTEESGAVLLGGHSVMDDEPKFGMSVTGLVDPETMFANTNAEPGDFICLTKALGTGIVTTANKHDQASAEEMDAAAQSMMGLNRQASEDGLAAGVRCATDVTGFGLAGHLMNIARGSGVAIEIDSASLPRLPGIERMIEADHTTGGSVRNRQFLGEALTFEPGLSKLVHELVVDPQTSGGLALFSKVPIAGYPMIGRVVQRGAPTIRVR